MATFNNKLIVVTGATGDIGQAIVTAFHAQHAKLVLIARDIQKLASLEKKLGSPIGKEICNFHDIKQVNLIIDRIERVHGPIDVLVSNAGIIRDKIAVCMNNSDWDDVVNFNLKVSFILNRDVIKHMIKRRYGRIINITSVVAQSGSVGQSNYSASKAGLIAMTKSLALEMATRNITVNAVAPGYIKTTMTANVDRSVISRIPMQRMGVPEDVANVVLFLAMDKASYITGQTIGVNGGLFMN